MELQQILSKMEADGWEISEDFKTAHGHFLQHFLETVEEELRQPPVSGSVIDIPLQYCPKCRSLEIKQKTKSHDSCKDCGHVWDIYRPWDNLS